MPESMSMTRLFDADKATLCLTRLLASSIPELISDVAV